MIAKKNEKNLIINYFLPLCLKVSLILPFVCSRIQFPPSPSYFFVCQILHFCMLVRKNACCTLTSFCEPPFVYGLYLMMHVLLFAFWSIKKAFFEMHNGFAIDISRQEKGFGSKRQGWNGLGSNSSKFSFGRFTEGIIVVPRRTF